MKSFTLEIITQEKPLLEKTVNSLTLNTLSGEITILAGHILLFSRLVPGELTYRFDNQSTHFAVTGGFVDCSPEGKVTVLADSAVRSDQINLAKAQEAVTRAKQALQNAKDQKTTLKIELELRHALLQANIAKKHHTTRS